MPSRRAWLLLLLAIVLRLLTHGWDSGLLTPHPDERQVAFVSEKVAGWLDDPGFYAYGSLHFRAVRAMSSCSAWNRSTRACSSAGRGLSLLASALAMLLGWWMASRAWGRRTAELFLLLIAFVPLDIQQSHYATVEAHHALWVMVALAACFWLATRSGWLPALAAGAAVGASLAVKVASLPLLLPLGLALVIAARRRAGSGLLASAGDRRGRHPRRLLARPTVGHGGGETTPAAARPGSRSCSRWRDWGGRVAVRPGSFSTRWRRQPSPPLSFW